ncbi:MAG: hypothetical protein B6D70_07000 [gamma proteobacterium symbiont of Stewartia floridana]|nr:MAG: hypothetical protein B6D76_11420 [gamma proteobacterium symbiont of Stewartia floridana]RLW58428.1 MAG: hypothetical protein B6D75_13615 [gamma proteobacterium symbiont of Stewartia floridana]RLW62863.1 MAG: hypothetical protein B6D70_07000 [gamma proteobacterium symbiont of Stewartia floridana]RLW64997.1 MAG: hypothetical protein B6D73_09340 [gamma proteobacterium symbiont of Stewartia floridana]RLW70034.1 MAG: hypothetical protein B6D71_07965 [gamma proteobacterium symbiont of Stewart
MTISCTSNKTQFQSASARTKSIHTRLFPPHLFCTLLIVYSSQATSSDSSQDQELHDLLSSLESQTELATKSGMNTDYIPGLATILYADELLARGTRTVWEAQGLVPDISLQAIFLQSAKQYYG